MCEIEDDGFSTVVGIAPFQAAPIGERCSDCHRAIAPDGTGHLSWCHFHGFKDFPRLHARHPATSIGE